MSTYLVLNNKKEKVNIYLNSSYIEPLKEILEIYNLSYENKLTIDKNVIDNGKKRIKENQIRIKESFYNNIFLLENTLIEWFNSSTQQQLCEDIIIDFRKIIVHLEYIEEKNENERNFLIKDESWFLVENDNFYEKEILNNEDYKGIIKKIALLAKIFSNYPNKYEDQSYVEENLMYYVDEYIKYSILYIILDLIKLYDLNVQLS